jgi:hypothetical protein
MNDYMRQLIHLALQNGDTMKGMTPERAAKFMFNAIEKADVAVALVPKGDVIQPFLIKHKDHEEMTTAFLLTEDMAGMFCDLMRTDDMEH